MDGIKIPDNDYQELLQSKYKIPKQHALSVCKVMHKQTEACRFAVLTPSDDGAEYRCSKHNAVRRFVDEMRVKGIALGSDNCEGMY